MASLPQLNDNRNSPTYPRDVAAAPLIIQRRYIATPDRSQSRRLRLNGAAGCQKASRIIYNEAYCRKAQMQTGRSSPISRSLGSFILQRAPEVLRNTLGIPRGKLTHTQMRNKRDLQPARRALEKYLDCSRAVLVIDFYFLLCLFYAQSAKDALVSKLFYLSGWLQLFAQR